MTHLFDDPPMLGAVARSVGSRRVLCASWRVERLISVDNPMAEMSLSWELKKLPRSSLASSFGFLF